MRGVLVVFSEEVAAEVALEVAPDRMDVVGAVLGIVELEEERGALDAVVMAFAGFLAAGPGEVDSGPAGGFDAGKISRGDFGAGSMDVFLDEAAKELLLRRMQAGEGETSWGVRCDLAFGPGDDVGGGLGLDDSDGALGGIEGTEEGEAQVFLRGQDAESLARALADFGGVGAEERGGSVDQSALDDGDIDREVVSLHAPAPGVGGARRTEDGQIVEGWITDWTAALLEVTEDLFEAHDGRGLHEAAMAESAGQEGDGEVVGGGAEFFEGETLAFAGDEVPVFAFWVGEVELGFGLLLAGEDGEELLGGAGHLQGWGAEVGRGVVLVVVALRRGAGQEEGGPQGRVNLKLRFHKGPESEGRIGGNAMEFTGFGDWDLLEAGYSAGHDSRFCADAGRRADEGVGDHVGHEHGQRGLCAVQGEFPGNCSGAVVAGRVSIGVTAAVGGCSAG